MFLKFAWFDDNSGILTPKEVLPYRSPSILYWNLGGPSCDGERRVTESFITLRAEEEEQVVMKLTLCFLFGLYMYFFSFGS